jgi:four helix bundle protein
MAIETTDIATKKADEFAHFVYHVTSTFPKTEVYGLTSQMRRASVSVVLNMIEGYARQSKNDYRRFLEISYGSLKETKYIAQFCFEEKLIQAEDYKKIENLCNEIGKLLWGKIRRLQ